mgnify:CR=1 FL=1
MIKKKFIFIGLFAALFFTACEDETNHYLHPTYLCGLKNNSGHDLKITLVREDTTVHYHFADNDSAVFVVGKGLYISDGYPGSGFGSLYTDQYWIPYDTVERIATLTFDDTYSHVSRVIYYFDSIGALERRICTPGDCNFFSKSRPFFDFHDYIQNDTVLEQYIITPAYYDQAVEQSAVSQK